MHLQTIARSCCLILSLALSGCSIMQEARDLKNDISGTASSTENISFPTDFPLPQYPQSRTAVATDANVDNLRIRSVMLICNDQAESICSYYTKWFSKNDWTIKTPTASLGIGSFISAEKNKDKVSITALRSKDAHETTLTINIASPKK